MKKQNTTQKHGLAMRILLLVLVALMVIGLAFTSIWMVVDQIKTKQAEKEKEKQEQEKNEEKHEHTEESNEDPEKYY